VTTDRPFRHEPTEVLQAALDLASTHAQQAARFRPRQQGDELPAAVDLLRAELQHRSQTLPPPQGPEYAPCTVCGHIEPEHRQDAGPCLVCDCGAYRSDVGTGVRRRIAGWVLLSLVPATFVTLAGLAGQLAEAVVGVAIAGGLSAAMWFGMDLITKPKKTNPDRSRP
jgi:hypothetical protein